MSEFGSTGDCIMAWGPTNRGPKRLRTCNPQAHSDVTRMTRCDVPHSNSARLTKTCPPVSARQDVLGLDGLVRCGMGRQV